MAVDEAKEVQRTPKRKTTRFVFALGCGCTLFAAAGYGLLYWSVRASADETLLEAETFLRQRDNAAARRTLRWLLWFDPAQDRALLITGVSLNADQRFAEAVAVLERIPPDSASAEPAGIALASSLVSDGRLARAESVLRGHLERFPHSADARDRLVKLYAKQLRIRDAAGVLNEFRRRNPGDSSVLPYLLDLEARTATPHEGIESLEAADAAHPGQPEVVLALARGYAFMGEQDAAWNRFQEALKLRPDDPKTRLHAAEFQLDIGNGNSAAELISLDSESKPTGLIDDDRYWFLRCRLNEQESDVEAALVHVRKALALRPLNETYLLMQATLLRRKGRTQEAEIAAEQALQLAAARKRLFMLSFDLDRNRPSRAHCVEIAELLERLGRAGQAAGWRKMARTSEFDPE